MGAVSAYVIINVDTDDLTKIAMTFLSMAQFLVILFFSAVTGTVFSSGKSSYAILNTIFVVNNRFYPKRLNMRVGHVCEMCVICVPN